MDITHLNNPKLGNACIVVGWKLPLNWFVLNKLKRGEPCACPQLAPNSEITALAYAMFQHVHELLYGNALAMTKSKAVNVCAGYNEEFFINITTASSFTAVRYCLNIVAKCSNITSLFSAYSANIRLLNGKPNKEEFFHVCNEMNKALAHTSCVIVSKTLFDADKLKTLKESFANHVDIREPASKGSAPLKGELGTSDYPSVKCKSGLQALVVAIFITTKFDVNVAINGDVVIVKNPNWTMKGNDASSIDLHINRLYAKLDKSSSINTSLAFFGMTHCLMGPSNLAEILGKKIAVSDIKSLLLLK